MKIVAATSPQNLLVEMSRYEFNRFAGFRPGGRGPDLDLGQFEVGKVVDVGEAVKNAEHILENLRCVGPELKRASERLARLSEEVERFNHKEGDAT